jgi:hypothetical protein
VSDFRHVACARDGDLFATALFERTVFVWSFRRRGLLSTFDTVLDFGGERLALIGGEKPVLVAAAYHALGLVGYDAISGGVLWARKDLKKVQHIAVSNSEQLLVGFEGQRFRRINPRTGNEVSSSREVKHAYAGPSPNDEVHVLGGRRPAIGLWDRSARAYLWRRPRETFGVLGVAASPAAVLVSEVGGAPRCITRDGEESWRWSSDDKGAHALKVAWHQSAKVWLAVCWNYKIGGALRLVRLSPSGALLGDLEIGNPAETTFFASGEHLLTTDGDVLDALDGSVTWRLPSS